MKVLIADKLPTFVVDEIELAGGICQVDPTLKDAALVERLKAFEPDALIVRSTKVTEQHIEASKQLQLVVRAGAGVNTIDLEAASRAAISVANCPGRNAIAVAELTLGHIINADRRIADNVKDLKAGQWKKKHYSKAAGLKGQTVGVIGCGAIGRAVIARLKAFEMNVVCFSPLLTEGEAKSLGIRSVNSVRAVAELCSILTVHVPRTPQTENLIDDDIIAALPDGAVVVNTSRGGIVDEGALLRAVKDRGFRAGLDVFADEPGQDGPWQNELAKQDGVYGTHHIGASTEQAQASVAAAACKIVVDWMQTGVVENCVNLLKQAASKTRLIVRHRDEVGVLASLLEHLRAANLNVKKMQNQIFSGQGGAACARINIDGHVADDLLKRLRDVDAVIDIQAIELQ